MQSISKRANTALKAIDNNGRVGGYLVVWGDSQTKDLQGEYFTPQTQFALDWYDKRPVLYHHGLDGTIKTARVGIIDAIKSDSMGLWAEAQIDLNKEYADAVMKLIEKGILSWSSGSLAHLVETDSDGQIKRWPLVEGSFTPTPAEPRHTNISAIKSAYYDMGLDPTKLGITADDDTDDKGATGRKGHTSDDAFTIINDDNAMKKEGIKMTRDELVALIKEVIETMKVDSDMSKEEVAEVQLEIQEELETKMDDDEYKMDDDEGKKSLNVTKLLNELPKAVVKAQEKMLNKRQAQSRAVEKAVQAARKNALRNSPSAPQTGGIDERPNRAHVHVADQYPDWEPEDYLFAAMINKQMHRHGKSIISSNPDERAQFFREFASKAEKSSLALSQSGLGAMKAIKADELNYSTQAGFGDEWVPDSWDSNLWRKARIDNVVAPQFNVVEMPTNPFELPIEGSDPTVYYVPETTNENQLTLDSSSSPIPDSKIGSGKVQLSTKKFGLRVGFSAELQEDSIIPILNLYRQQAETTFMESIDSILLNGDTETGTTNINSDGVALASTSKFLGLNGLRKNTFTNSSNQENTGSVPTLAQIRATRFLLSRQVSTKLAGLRIFIHPEVEAKLLGLDEFVTMDKAGTRATAMTGQIGLIDNIPVLTTDQLFLADTDGKVTSGGNVTDTGTLIMVYAPHWYVGYRRRLSTSLDYIPYYDSYQLTMTARMDFKPQDSDSVAMMFNITV